MRTGTISRILLPALILLPRLFSQEAPTINPNVAGFTAFVGDPFSQAFTCVSCSSGTITWQIGTGSLPAGLTLQGTTGVLSGTPTTTQTVSFTINAVVLVNGEQIVVASRTYSITVDAGVTVVTTSLANGVVGTAYSQTLTATGGAPPYSNWTLSSGSLPPGLSLNSSGAISGTPTTSGGFSFSVTVKDSAGGTSPAQSLSISVAAINPSVSGFSAYVGDPFSQAFTCVSCGTFVITWQVGSGSLPAGLTLNSSTGVLSGTPTTIQTVSFTLNAVSNFNVPVVVASRTYSITVGAGVTVTTTSLAGGVVGTAYSQTLGATGGTPPYTGWSVSSGALPPGLTLAAASGVISGTPTASGTFSFCVTVRDSLEAASPAQCLSITIAGALAVATTSLPGGVVGTAYSQTLTATGGTPPYVNWSVSSGSLPPGLTLAAATGVISGTPTTGGTFPFSVTVKDSAGATSAPQSLSITVAAALTVVTTSLPNGVVGTAYSQTLTATGGTPPYVTWSLSSGSLPPGLNLNASSGVISGSPTTSGAFSFSVTVRDSAGAASPAQSLSITVAAGVTIVTTSLANGVVGTAYSQTLTATGGTPPYSNWSLFSGSLPPGLSLNASTGVISGTPTSSGTFSFSVTVKDSAGSTSPAQSLSITIAAALTVVTTSLPNGVAGTAYSQTLTATGGTPPYVTWSLSSGSLPPGLSLNASSGVISGTPTTSGTFSFAVTVRDSAGSTSPAQALSITIAAALTVVTTSLPNGVVGTAYSQTLVATGGQPPYVWTIFQGNLPAGLALSAAGTIGGVPTTPGTSQFVVRVADANGTTASATLSLSIAAPLLTITTTSIPSATVGASYSETFGATGGNPPYTWALDSGSLPAGLSLSNSGSITGVPAANSAGTYAFTVRVTDTPLPGSPSGNSTTRAFTLQVNSSSLTITTSSLANGVVGQAYSATLAASGGTPPYTWSVSTGTLPAGLNLAANGALSGTPTSAGASTFTIAVTDSQKQTATKSFSVTISPAALAISGTLNDGVVGAAYSGTLTASGGTPPYSFSVASGALPDGLSLNTASGLVSGTPTRAGAFSFTIAVTDSQKQTAAQSFSMNISAALAIGGSLGNGVVGTAYSGTITAAGGTPPYSFSVASGALPDGLSLSAASGLISGTPTKAGAFSFGIRLSDSHQPSLTATQAFTINISNPTLPGVSVTQLQDTMPSQGQPSFGVSMTQPYPLDLTGIATISFKPISGPVDPDVLFANGQTTIDFTIPAGQTAAVAPAGTPLAFQTGTTAGTITITIILSAGGQPLNPNPAATRTIVIPNAPPVITSVQIVTTSSGFNILVAGYSNTREISGSTFAFIAGSGASLQTSTFSVPVATAFQAWFSGTQSASFGGQFLLTMPFNVTQGSASSLSSVQVTLTNSAGSTSASGNF
jgi:hypothetical protein